jgi:hypothetical protein
MTIHHPPATYEDVLQAIGSLIDYIKVLVTAVDDLRCEVEWRNHNSTATDGPSVLNAPLRLATECGGAGEEDIRSADREIATDSLLSATGRLRAYEKLLYRAPRGLWLNEWSEHDDFETPTGRIISVSSDIYESLLDIRPAHVVDDSCCCEAGEAAPYLLVWHTDREFLLRELTDEEAEKLQEFCLACQAERANAAIQEARLTPSQSQLGLF